MSASSMFYCKNQGTWLQDYHLFPAFKIYLGCQKLKDNREVQKL